MNPKQRARWEKVRAKGKLRYIVVYGILMYVICVSIVSWLFAQFVFKERSDITVYVIRIIIFAIGGYFFGSNTWKKLEKKYQETQDEKRNR